MRNYVKKNQTPAERSAIYQANGRKGAARHAENAKKRNDALTRMLKLRVNARYRHEVTLYTEDYIVLHRYCRQEKRKRLDVLHELVSPLRAKIKDAVVVRPDDPWLIAHAPEDY